MRPSNIAWGLAAGGAGLLGSSAMAVRPFDVAVLAPLSLVIGAVAWRGGRRLGLLTALLAGLIYALRSLTPNAPLTLESLRAVPAALGFLALAMALSETSYLVQGLAQSNLLDQVTHLPNYDLFMRFLRVEASRSMRYRLPFCLVLLEVDNFEGYSRSFGYWRSNSLLKELARIMADTLRRSDVLGHLGGSQFGMLLPMTPSQGALVALQRIENAVKLVPLPVHRGSSPTPISWQVGIAEFPSDGQDAADLLNVAGQRLGLESPPQRLAIGDNSLTS